ncbi:MAG: hypothetical protein WC998_09640, partial [Candidatus Paceibacterota bacterium]
MVELPQSELPTVSAIYKNYSDNKSEWRREHLGASLIGKECERSLFYTLRWCNDPRHPPRILRLFETGFREEARLIKNLRSIGICIYDLDPDSGKQNYYSSFGGHYAGSLDGIAVNFPEAPKTWHVVEFKSSSTKEFNKLRKDGIQKSKPLHYAQVQQYMNWSGLDRAFYFVVCKENDSIYAERIYYDPLFAEHLMEKAKRIIFSDTPPERITSSAGNFQCRFCEHNGVCWEKELPEVNCRTCAFVTPEQNGTWTCGRTGKVIEPINQRRIQDCHIFIPELVPLKVVDSDPEAGTITYEGGIVNGPCHVLSKDLARVLRERGNNSDMYETHMECSSYDTSKPDMAGVAYG